jgi:hypothetical protein
MNCKSNCKSICKNNNISIKEKLNNFFIKEKIYSPNKCHVDKKDKSNKSKKSQNDETYYDKLFKIIEKVNSHKQCQICTDNLDKIIKNDNDINVSGKYKTSKKNNYDNHKKILNNNYCLPIDEINKKCSESELNVKLSKLSMNDEIIKDKIENLNQDDKDDKCSICFTDSYNELDNSVDNNQNNTTLFYSLCGDSKIKHNICYSCFESLLKNNSKQCPICRRDIKQLYHEHSKFISHTIKLVTKQNKIELEISTDFNIQQIRDENYSTYAP